VVVVFVMTHLLPGNPLLAKMGMQVDPVKLKELERSMGLDKPLVLQLVDYARALAAGDLGDSVKTGRPVKADLLQRLPATLELSLAAMLAASVVGIPLGILAALRRGTGVDRAIQSLAVLGASTPIFWFGLGLIFVLYQQLGLVPSPSARLPIGMAAPPARTGLLVVDSILSANVPTLRAALAQLFLPTLTLSVVVVAPMIKISRGTLLQVLGSDYIQTARAIGLPERQIVLQDALRNMLVTILTVVGLNFGYLLGGNVIVESIFAWPGIGLYAWNALAGNDYNAVQGFVLLVATIYIALNLAIDLLYAVIDPRVRVG
jgi:ABC-type dipeptide/oligopeptide/nickel transport system permease component